MSIRIIRGKKNTDLTDLTDFGFGLILNRDFANKPQTSMPQASRAARRLSAELVPTSKSRESEAAMVNGYALPARAFSSPTASSPRCLRTE